MRCKSSHWTNKFSLAFYIIPTRLFLLQTKRTKSSNRSRFRSSLHSPRINGKQLTITQTLSLVPNLHCACAATRNRSLANRYDRDKYDRDEREIIYKLVIAKRTEKEYMIIMKHSRLLPTKVCVERRLSSYSIAIHTHGSWCHVIHKILEK